MLLWAGVGGGGSLSRLGFAFLLSAAWCLLCAEGSAPTDCANVHGESRAVEEQSD